MTHERDRSLPSVDRGATSDENTEAGFMSRLENEILRAGHDCSTRKSATRDTLFINGQYLSIRVTANRSPSRVSSTKPNGRLTVTIGEYRFATRKAGWDWAAIVQACVETIRCRRAETERRLAREAAEDATESHPDMIAARKLVESRPGWQILRHDGHGRLELVVRGITPSQALAMLRAQENV